MAARSLDVAVAKFTLIGLVGAYASRKRFSFARHLELDMAA